MARIKITPDQYLSWTNRLLKQKRKLNRAMRAWQRCEVVPNEHNLDLSGLRKGGWLRARRSANQGEEDSMPGVQER